MAKYTSRVYILTNDDTIEYGFDGSGYSTAATYWDPGDSEMNLDSCRKYIHGDKIADKDGVDYDIDLAIKEIAQASGKSEDWIVDYIVEKLWADAEYDEPDYD